MMSESINIICMTCSIWDSPGGGDNELGVLVGNQVTLVFWILHCHLLVAMVKKKMN